MYFKELNGEIIVAKGKCPNSATLNKNQIEITEVEYDSISFPQVDVLKEPTMEQQLFETQTQLLEAQLTIQDMGSQLFDLQTQ
jgi:hypothetical protein